MNIALIESLIDKLNIVRNLDLASYQNDVRALESVIIELEKILPVIETFLENVAPKAPNGQ